jgi:hypothetical protein
MLSRKKVIRLVANLAFAGVLAVVVIGITCLALSGNPNEQEEVRLRAAYEARFARLESEYLKRDRFGYKMSAGEGPNHALVASGIRPELGSTDSIRYKACMEAVRKINRFDADWAGHTMFVPSGKTCTATVK